MVDEARDKSRAVWDEMAPGWEKNREFMWRTTRHVAEWLVEKVEAGGLQVAEAGAAMDDIVLQVRKVTDLIGEIASAAQEQSRGIGQVNQAVTQMDQVTQQNAALVEEAAAAAASMQEQAGRHAPTSGES